MTIESCWRCGTLTTVVDGRCVKCNLDLSEEWLRHPCASTVDTSGTKERRDE